MNLLKEKRILDTYINEKINNLRFKNYKINLVGTASLQSQLYFSDYDFNTNIKKKYKPLDIYMEIKKILNNNNNNIDLYFLELKIIYDNDSNIKIYDIHKINKSMFKNVKSIKIDYVLFYNYHFKELSMIYLFRNEKINIINELEKDYEEFIKDNNYFKALKRLFSIYRLTNNGKEATKLLKYFNSDYGKLYQTNSNLKTLLLLQDNPEFKRLIDINLKYLNLSPNIDIEEEIEKNNKILNNESKKYLI